MAEHQLTHYPLGGNVFAYVKIKGKRVKIHVRHFTFSETKGKTIETQRGVSLDSSQLKRLCKVKKKLVAEHDQHSKALEQTAKEPTRNKKKEKDEERLPTDSSAMLFSR